MNEKTFKVTCRDKDGNILFVPEFEREGTDEDQGKDMEKKYLERLHGIKARED